MPLAYTQKPGWDYEPVTDDRDAAVTVTLDELRAMIWEHKFNSASERQFWSWHEWMTR